jgi:hypothetical protein
MGKLFDTLKHKTYSKCDDNNDDDDDDDKNITLLRITNKLPHPVYKVLVYVIH